MFVTKISLLSMCSVNVIRILNTFEYLFKSHFLRNPGKIGQCLEVISSNCYFEGQICCYEDDRNMFFDIFSKYGQNSVTKVRKMSILTFHCLETMARNHKNR